MSLFGELTQQEGSEIWARFKKCETDLYYNQILYLVTLLTLAFTVIMRFYLKNKLQTWCYKQVEFATVNWNDDVIIKVYTSKHDHNNQIEFASINHNYNVMLNMWKFSLHQQMWFQTECVSVNYINWHFPFICSFSWSLLTVMEDSVQAETLSREGTMCLYTFIQCCSQTAKRWGLTGVRNTESDPWCAQTES